MNEYCDSYEPCTRTKYGYDLAGNPTGLTNSVGALNESGQTMSLLLTTGFDGAAHMNSVTSNWGTYPTNLFTIVPTNGYWPAGELWNWTLGPNLSITQGVTNRLWVNSISATGQVP